MSAHSGYANNCKQCNHAFKHLVRHERDLRVVSAQTWNEMLQVIDALAQGVHPEFVLIDRDFADEMLSALKKASSQLTEVAHMHDTTRNAVRRESLISKPSIIM